MAMEQEVSGTMKKFTTKLAFGLSTLLPVLLMSAQSPLAQAQQTEPAIYACTQCVKHIGWRGILDFGLGYVSDDSLRFGDYRGLEKEGAYAAVDGDVHFRNLQGRYFDLYAYDLGYDSRRLEMRGGNQGSYQLRLAWSEIPKYRGYGTQTPFLGVGSDNLTLPADWVHSSTTGGMSALESSLAAAQLKTQRKTLDAGATVNFARNWSYRVDYQRQEKKGTRSLGAGFYFNNSTILPAPVDFTTDQFDMGLSWTGQRAQVQLGFIGSYFDNGNTSLTWQNPFTAIPYHQTFRAALEPDNEFYQFNLSGAFAITPRIRVSGQAALGELSQDEPFLPVTINPLYSDLPLPRLSLDGQLDTSTFNLAGKLSAKLSNRLSFAARGKFNERDNKTPVDLYMQVPADLVPSRTRYNRPYSYEREQYSADLRFRAHRVFRLSGGAQQENIERTLQATERTEETTVWGEAKVNPSFNSHLRLKLESSNRDVSNYAQPDDGGPVDHPLMRKFNQADRSRERALIVFDFAPFEALGINLSYFHAKADYGKSEIGLQESDEQSYTINLNYAVGTKVNVYAFLTRDDIDADLLNTTGGSAVPWHAVTNDRITTAGLGLSTRISEKSSIGLDFVASGSKGDISVQTTADEDPFDPLKTDLTNTKAHFDYEANDHWTYKLYAEYEKYNSQDWAIDGLGVDGISPVLTMGEQGPEYKAWYFRAQASYRF
jgi:MtrB/PioB family decaheme-associated outer membrane protein